MKANCILLASSLFLLSSCGAGKTPEQTESRASESSSATVESLSFDEKAITVKEDTVTKIRFSSSGKASFASSAPEVAEMSGDGTLLAKSVGEAVITGTVGQATDSLKVTVVSSSSSSGDDCIKLAKTSAPFSLESVSPYQIQAEVIVGEKTVQNPSLSFVSSDETVATVSSSGLLTPLKEGQASIEVSYGELKATFKADVYTKEVKTAADWLSLVSEENQNKYDERYFVSNDIDFSGVEYKGYTPIGIREETDHGFCGEINGFGHSLSNITMAPSIDYHQSLFGMITGATIKNISFENVRFSCADAGCLLNGIGAYAFVYEHDGEKRFNEISNVFLDLIFPKDDVVRTGLFTRAYAVNLDNVFLSMKTEDGSDFNPTKCALFSQCHSYWWGNASVSSSVFYSPSSLSLVSGYGQTADPYLYGENVTSNVFLAESEMDAIYGAGLYLDGNAWDFHPSSYPTLKQSD